MTLSDFICSTYNDLLNSGWRMHEIDHMDFLGFLHIRAWSANHKKSTAKPRRAYIDEVWKSMKP